MTTPEPAAPGIGATGLGATGISATGISEDDALTLLRDGALELEGRLVEASNTTLRAFLSADGVTLRCVYKPVRGERPLWDFPDGTLAGREVAAYLVSRAAGWNVVPPTVLRDGPLGPGACQLWIDEVEDGDPLVAFVPVRRLPKDWLSIMAARDETGRPYALAHADDGRLASLAVFDAVVNNADRKGGHVLVDARQRVYGVDHGLCFHTDDKLRTVLWGWADGSLPAPARAVLAALADRLNGGGSASPAGDPPGDPAASPGGDLAGELAAHISPAEIEALRARIDRLRATGRFPVPSTDWPAVPWPPI